MRSREKNLRRVARASCAPLFLSVACLVVLNGARAQSGWAGARQGEPGKDLNAVYFVDSKRGWVAGDGGVVLRTKDGGRSWSPQGTGTTDSVNDIYFRDKEDGYLLAGNQIFVTEDGGETWRLSLKSLAGEFGGAEPEFGAVDKSGNVFAGEPRPRVLRKYVKVR